TVPLRQASSSANLGNIKVLPASLSSSTSSSLGVSGIQAPSRSAASRRSASSSGGEISFVVSSFMVVLVVVGLTVLKKKAFQALQQSSTFNLDGFWEDA